MVDSIKNYLASGVAVLLLLVLIPTALQNVSLKQTVETLQADKTTLKAETLQKRFEIKALELVIDDQNQRIDKLGKETREMQAQKQQALLESAKRVAQLNDQVARLQFDKGKSCTVAGIGSTILNEVLP